MFLDIGREILQPVATGLVEEWLLCYHSDQHQRALGQRGHDARFKRHILIDN